MERSCRDCNAALSQKPGARNWPQRCGQCAEARRSELQIISRKAIHSRRAEARSRACCIDCGAKLSVEMRTGPVTRRCTKCRNAFRLRSETKRRESGATCIHTKACLVCRRDFKTARPQQKYCSYECSHVADRRRCTVKCFNAACGKEFEAPLGRSQGSRFCCRECMYAARACPPCRCHNCGSEFSRKHYAHEWQGKNKYCSRNCYLDHRWGKDRPRKQWSHLATEAACRKSLATSLRKRCKHYGVPFDPACTREAVCERDGWVCQQCGIKCHKGRHRFNKRTRKLSKRNAEHDHIVPLSWRDPTKGNTFENSQCLCRRCNGRKHNFGGGQMRLNLVEC